MAEGRQSRKDHPRVCGEKSARFHLTSSLPGSPPRMRGKDNHMAPSRRWQGITPAYAGKSKYCHALTSLDRDHPRVCGEKNLFSAGRQTLWGSPPRMRGKVHQNPVMQALDGITPAYAGKSKYCHALTSLDRDHPRVCGEKTSKRLDSCPPQGSPPRMRGKAVCHCKTPF